MSIFIDELTSILNGIRPDKDFSEAEDFFEQGMLDSLDLTTLISELESRYGIFVDIDEIVPDSFRNVEAIKGFLARKGVNIQ